MAEKKIVYIGNLFLTRKIETSSLFTSVFIFFVFINKNREISRNAHEPSKLNIIVCMLEEDVFSRKKSL